MVRRSYLDSVLKKLVAEKEKKKNVADGCRMGGAAASMYVFLATFFLEGASLHLGKSLCALHLACLEIVTVLLVLATWALPWVVYSKKTIKSDLSVPRS